MKYSDEVAQTSTVQLAKRKKYSQDIDSLIRDYEHLLESEEKKHRRIHDLEKDLGAMRRARDGFKSKFEATSRENVTLKTTLRGLRRSTSLRLGKMITQPANAAMGMPKLLTKAIRASIGRKLSPQPVELMPGTASVSEPIEALPAALGQDGHAARFEQLLQDFTVTPSKGSLLNLISYEYFVQGAISVPAARILENQELVAAASGSDRRLIANILGQDSLLQSGVFLSPRQPNPGYLVERGRIMYCAHSTGYFNSNGYSTRTAGLVAGLDSNGEDVLVVARPGYPWDAKTDVFPPGHRRFERTISGVPHIFNPGPNWSEDRLDRYLNEAVDIYVREAQRNRVAVIHAASNYVTALPALMAARRLGIPFVYEVRGIWEITELSNKPLWTDSDRFRLAKQLETVVAQEADSVFAITTQVKDELIRRGVDADTIDILPNSVDSNRFKPMPRVEALGTTLGLSDDAIVIGYAGSLVAYEGLMDLLEATKIVIDRGLNAQLVIVGDGKQLAELKKAATGLGIRDRVVFTGRVPAESVADYVSLFDIMPCPRRRLPVTEMVSPLKPLEAMASGKALILSDLAPSHDLAGLNQERALLCAPGDPESIATAVMSLATDVEMRTSLGRCARLWAVNERTWLMTGQIAAEVHHRLQDSAGNESGRSLKGLRIGIIADEFTLEGLLPEADFVVLRPESWHDQLQDNPIDALFVESAWEGVEGLWRQKVGYYDGEKFAVLKSLLGHCNAGNVPTIFWNKEDPVHFNRFSVTAEHFDHVFTTDSGCIRKYQIHAGDRLQTVASLPFYAQPRLHNILPSERAYEHVVTYAGSYYGEKYPKRSAELSNLLNAAKENGLAIYDRQHLAPESPYRFPPELDPFVRGGLSYGDVVQAYKAHPVHINVNSVYSSPTMFSRRVMEIAASGGAVVSGTGEGVENVLNGLVPVVKDQEEAALLMKEWMSNEEVRLGDVWLAYRLVHRGHTAAHRLSYALRTAGLTVRAPEPAPYAIFVKEITPELLAVLAKQTVAPRLVFCRQETPVVPAGVIAVRNVEHAKELASNAGVKLIASLPEGVVDRTVFEDLLTAFTFGNWNSVSQSEEDMAVTGLGMARPGSQGTQHPRIDAIHPVSGSTDLTLRRTLIPARNLPLAIVSPAEPKTILVAGHDLKFAGPLMEELQRRGHEVIVDKWLDHNKHDEATSLKLLKFADVVFCEWTLGNAVWYSRNKLPHQRLVTRLHSQEIFRPYLKSVVFSNVDEVVFVGQHIADIAVRDHGVPRDRCVVVPNQVDVEGLFLDKPQDARFNLGFVGIVPAQKHFDKALDVLKRLRASDKRYRLFVKGKRPEDFPWMASRPAEMTFYEDQYARIASDPDLMDAVTFDPHGDDMAEWYKKIGIVLSVSDFESFHLTLADGAASGALPVSLAWPGADQIYPTSWLHSDVAGIADRILEVCESPEKWNLEVTSAREFVARHLDAKTILPKLCDVIDGSQSAVGALTTIA